MLTVTTAGSGSCSSGGGGDGGSMDHCQLSSHCAPLLLVCGLSTALCIQAQKGRQGQHVCALFIAGVGRRQTIMRL